MPACRSLIACICRMSRAFERRLAPGLLHESGGCQAAVSLPAANDHASLPLTYRLYLPHEWLDDPVRHAESGVPDDIVFQTKPQIALDQLRMAPAAQSSAMARSSRSRPSRWRWSFPKRLGRGRRGAKAPTPSSPHALPRCVSARPSRVSPLCRCRSKSVVGRNGCRRESIQNPGGDYAATDRT
jgi:DDE superfamily endonuclease